MSFASFSLLTIVKGRRRHLNALLRGISAARLVPTEMVIVFMNEELPDDLPILPCRLTTATLHDADHALPLAAARNRAAKLATTPNLLFLDVDCIPNPDYTRVLLEALSQYGGLLMGEVRYLPEPLPDDWTLSTLTATGLPHPRRPQVPVGAVQLTNTYHLFWSLSFAITKIDFERIGGFDEHYVGYGGEDTDFAFSARDAGLPFRLVGAVCYHQHHATCTPPYNHLEDIVTNAKAFYEKWGKWPMEGWLDAFAASGHVRRSEDDLELLRLPTEEDIARHRSDAPFA